MADRSGRTEDVLAPRSFATEDYVFSVYAISHPPSTIRFVLTMPSVPCPTCNRPVEWVESSRWKPFCSERCKLIDLGAWASGQRTIPGEEIKEDEDPDTEARDEREE